MRKLVCMLLCVALPVMGVSAVAETVSFGMLSMLNMTEEDA